MTPRTNPTEAWNLDGCEARVKKKLAAAFKEGEACGEAGIDRTTYDGIMEDLMEESLFGSQNIALFSACPQVKTSPDQLGDPLVSDTDGIEDALKVLAEIEGPTEPLRKMLEELRDKTLGKEDRADLANAIPLALLDLEKYFDEGDDDLRGSAGI